MARKITTKRFVENIKIRLRKKELTKQRARKILTGKMVSIRRKKCKALADEKIIISLKRRL